MTSQRSLCFMLNEQRVRAVLRAGSNRRHFVVDKDQAESDVVLPGPNAYKGQWMNLALGCLDFKYVPSQLLTYQSTTATPQIGDVCVRLREVVGQSEEYAGIVDLYNMYIANGSPLIAQTRLNSYTGAKELYIPAIPIQTLVSEWNESLQQFRDLIRTDGSENARTQRDRRLSVMANVTEIALKNVPILSNHLWYVLHCVVSRPCLVKHFVQLIGSVSSISSRCYHTGVVENTTVPGRPTTTQALNLYLVAKSPPATGNDVTVLGQEAGVTLGLIWAAEEEELYDHLRNSGSCYYVHIGTDAGNTFRCNGFSQWRYYNYKVFQRMTVIGQEIVSSLEGTTLAGNTGDSARLLNRS